MQVAAVKLRCFITLTSLAIAANTASCAASSRTSGASPTTADPSATPKPASPPPLPDIDRRRLEYALDSIGTLLDEWPGAKTVTACIHLYREDVEWLLGCADFRGGSFVRTSETFRGDAVLASSSPVFFFGSVVPFEKLAAAFPATVVRYNADVPASAAYRGKPWFVLQTFDSLTQHHRGFSAKTSTERWLGIVAHEYFHLSQMQRATVRDFIGAHSVGWKAKPDPGQRLMTLYDEPEFRKGIEEEISILRTPLEASRADVIEARRALLAWRKLRRERLARFEDRLPNGGTRLWEDFELYVEGLGRYVENRYLVDARFHPDASRLAIDPRFHGFEDLEGKRFGHDSYGQPGRPYFYEVGLLVGMLLDIVDPSWKATVSEGEGLLVGRVEAL